MSTIELLSPAGVVIGSAVPLAKRGPTLEGRVVGLLDNSKSGTRPFLDRVEELLQREHRVSRIIRYDKKAENYLGLTKLACALLWWRRLCKLCDEPVLG